MNRKFNYKEKFAFSNCYPAIAFIVLAVATEIFHFGINFGNFHLLAYPNSLHILGLSALICVASAHYKYNSVKKLNPIEIEENGISFPQGNDERVSVAFADVTELCRTNYENEGEQMVIFTRNNERYVLKKDCFDSSATFSEFEKIMNENCINVNR